MKTTIAAAAAITAAIALAGCGSMHAAPPATTAAVSSAPAAPTHTAAPSQADQLAAWVTTPGYTDLQAVQADLTALSTDADAEDMPATETDAGLLATDAQTAQDNPPPFGTGTYTAAMRDYATAGNEAESGDFADATVNMEEGTALVNHLTAAVNRIGS